jgi:hypothetical protein
MVSSGSADVTLGQELWHVIETKQNRARLDISTKWSTDANALRKARRSLAAHESCVEALRAFLARHGGR